MNTQTLTAKQRKWIKVYSETHNATEAAMQVYNCKDRNSAKQIGYENLTKLDFNELMEAMGLTDESLLESITEGQKATKPIVTPKGEIKAVPDYATRHKYIDTALKLKGKLSNKLEVTGENGNPIRMEVLAGIAHLPVKDDRNSDPDTKPEGDASVATSGFVPRPTEIQDADLAQTSQKDNDSTE
jgi:hypothetical protein